MANSRVDLIDVALQIDAVSNLDFAPLHRARQLTGLDMFAFQMGLESAFGFDARVASIKCTVPEGSICVGLSDMPVDHIGHFNGGQVRDRDLGYRAGWASKRQGALVCGDNCGGRAKRKRGCVGKMGWRRSLESMGRKDLRIRSVNKRDMARRKHLESVDRKGLRIRSVGKRDMARRRSLESVDRKSLRVRGMDKRDISMSW